MPQKHSPQTRAKALRELLPDVTPLPPLNRAHAPKSPPRPIPAQRLRDDREVLNESLSDQDAWEAGLEAGDELNFLRPGLASTTLRKLRRGYWLIQRELDLHGLTVAEARPALVSFLNDCLRDGARCVRIIHGKGIGVQRELVRAILRRTAFVVHYEEALPAAGSWGATVAWLGEAAPTTDPSEDHAKP